MTLHLSSSQLFITTFAVSHIIYQLSIFYYTMKTMHPRSHIRHTFLLSLPFLLLPLIYTLMTGEVTSASYKSILFFSPFLASMILYQGSLLQHIENNMFILLFAGCFELITGIIYYMVNYIFHLELNTSSNTIAPQNDPLRLFLFIFPPVIAQMIFTPFAISVWNNYVRYMNLRVLFKLGLIAFCIGTGILYVFPEHFGVTGWIFVFLGLFFSSILFYQGLYELQRILKKFHIHKKKENILKQNLSDFEELQEKNLLLRKQNHDITGHLQAVSLLLREGRVSEAKEYIRDFL